MIVCVLVPSEEYRSYAGARIRYGRLRGPLAALDVDLHFEDISQFAPAQTTCDVLLISKCHDARSLIAAYTLGKRGCLVGVDLFDDYFSQETDSRLVRFRNWLKQLLPICDFAICSTTPIAKLTGHYRHSLPIHVVKDPAEVLPVSSLSSILSTKMARVLDGQKIQLAWFGVGDNPYFQVGLADLASFGGILEPLRRSGCDIELTVLTNRRALDSDGLSRIGRLPVRTIVQEWTEERERELLTDAFACFLPVNSQAFSTAKSLNRAITALSAGCQVISVGYPLYEPLGSYIYRDVDAFLTDVGRGQMRLSADRLDSFQIDLESHASPAREALSLFRFLDGLVPSTMDGAPPLALVHGQVTTDAAHTLVRSIDGFSVASPYCTADLDFDVIFHGEPSRPVMLVSNSSVGRLTQKARERLKKTDRIARGRFWELPTEPSGPECGQSSIEVPLSLQLATYRTTLKRIGAQMEEAFGPCRILVSEISRFPFLPEVGLLSSC